MILSIDTREPEGHDPSLDVVDVPISGKGFVANTRRQETTSGDLGFLFAAWTNLQRLFQHQSYRPRS